MQKNRKLEKKIFKKLKKHRVFISDNTKRGLLVYFSGDLGIWDMAVKSTQILGPKNRFLSIEPRKTSSLTSNHSKSCREFIFILPIQI